MAEPEIQPEILKADEVAEILRVKPSTVADMARSGDLPSFKLGRRRLYYRSDILGHVENLRRENRAAA